MTFYEFFQIQIVDSLYFDINEPVPFSKDCMIGIEGCVNVDGSISICYKADTFIIGNVVENTWYFDKIDEFHKIRYSRPGCKYCFVQRFCKLCYEKLSGKQDQLQASIQNYCEFNRYYYRVIFEYMLKITERNPGLWDELQKQAEEEKEYLMKRRQSKKSLKNEQGSSKKVPVK
jgi:sulfatase maturation enzyme AslB (radical SAM superfamily)